MPSGKARKMKRMLSGLFARWKAIAHTIGEFQSRMILSVFYFVVFAPFALGLKLFSDPLQIKHFQGWQIRADAEENPSDVARRQF
jgi:hypothetical protein